MKRIKTSVVVLVLAMMICSCGKNINSDIEEVVIPESISDEQAVEAIRNYCCTVNSDLESIAAKEYPVYWVIESSDDSEVVVMFRSYTGAQVRYYIDRVTGTTNITEFVQGITEEEEPTGESFDVREYMN